MKNKIRFMNSEDFCYNKVAKIPEASAWLSEIWKKNQTALTGKQSSNCYFRKKNSVSLRESYDYFFVH